VTGEDMVQFVVRDTGVGITPDNIERIFEEYVQVEGPLQRHAGAGLGLPLSRKLAELLGGSLTATSIVGHGSEFNLRIPRTYQPEASRNSASAHPALPAVQVQHA
jgi:signal transduction histidine kinase